MPLVLSFLTGSLRGDLDLSCGTGYTRRVYAHVVRAPYNSSISSSPRSRAGKSPASHRSGRTKAPQFLVHSKYRLPLTDPSFLPVGSSSVTPTQTPIPGISGTIPMYETVPLRASVSGRRRTRHESVRPVASVSCCSCKFVEADDQYWRCIALAPSVRGSCESW
jgi:hypothetical protein